jgi:hypothetical protein
MVVKVPRNQEVLVDQDGLPGVYMAWVVAMLNGNLSSSNVSGSLPFVVKSRKSSLVESVFSPQGKFVAGSDGNVDVAVDVTSSNGKADSGECLPQLPEGGLLVAATSHGNDLQAEGGSRPVENQFGIQVDTKYDKTAQDDIGQPSWESRRDKVVNGDKQIQKGTQILGYVPIQVVNLSLEEVKLERQTYVGKASPVSSGNVVQGFEINHVSRDTILNPGKFEGYLQEKLAHLRNTECRILEPVLRKYKHLFYGLGSTQLGCTSQVEHSIETGDAKPIRRNPYRIPHVLKAVVDEHIDDMMQKEITEPSMSPWSSSIVLVQKKSRDESITYRFRIDYKALNAVTKPHEYPIPYIVDTLDSLGQSKIFSVLDMALGYYQIAIKPDHREKTVFSCHRSHFQFIKMPFGLNNAPATYQRYIDVVLMGLKGIDCLVYLEDIICFSATMEEHAQKLQTIFERLEQANFKIQPKFFFATDTVEYLEHICTPLGIRADPKKVKAIMEYSVPRTVRYSSFYWLSRIL